MAHAASVVPFVKGAYSKSLATDSLFRGRPLEPVVLGRAPGEQAQAFLDSEADAWFERNQDALQRAAPERDVLYNTVLEHVADRDTRGTPLKILEIGCANGYRLRWFKDAGFDVRGVDASSAAIADGIERLGLSDSELQVGDAATFLAENRERFDVILFGFCLYLADPVDIPTIVAGTVAQLVDDGLICIWDFDAPVHRTHYRHRPGIFSYKTSFDRWFTWLPYVRLRSKRVLPHGEGTAIGDASEDCAVAVLQKVPVERFYQGISH